MPSPRNHALVYCLFPIASVADEATEVTNQRTSVNRTGAVIAIAIWFLAQGTNTISRLRSITDRSIRLTALTSNHLANSNLMCWGWTRHSSYRSKINRIQQISLLTLSIPWA